MLSKLYKKHNKWVNIVKKLGGGDFSEDIVQEMYLRIHKINLIEQTAEVYVYYTLRNMTYSFFKEKSKYNKIDLNDCKFLEYLEDQGKEELETIYERIENEVEDWHWYDKMLWQLYTEDRTMRELAKDTKISLSSIFHTIKTCKERIKIAVGEDYEDYVNEDYEKI